ncbi:MAG: radical SAM protein [Candidatus Omnitrophica bacterium]|nr:radical SAM protein [Candidatus Omnitrophota bacterium]MDD5237760.1 radical SAM protein [Candidatus Omnitrophota bacterium]
MKNILTKIYFKYAGHIFSLLPWLLNFIPPRTLVVEASNMCVLNCPACTTVNLSKRAKGKMSFGVFKILLDGIDWKPKQINFSFAGEPLLNHELFKMIRYAKDKGIDSVVETNGMLLSGCIDELLDSGIYKLNIAFDGISQENISKYRRGMDFNVLLSAIRQLVATRARRNLRRPKVHLQFIVMKHNQDYIDRAIEMAKELEVDAIDFKSMIISVGLGFNREARQKHALEYLPDLEEFLRYKQIEGEWQLKENYRGFCTQVLSDAVIMWNGDVTVCSMDVQGDLVVGNILKSPLRKIWVSNKYSDLRQRILKRQLESCGDCGYLLGIFKSVKVKN